mmetsp:Transcript_23892/g.66202  ORF Transcript_23892/g.66202 Transcript_23892/m.66202 type:complete len:273 (-) Transcript_23892:574-1392(-)
MRLQLLDRIFRRIVLDVQRFVMVHNVVQVRLELIAFDGNVSVFESAVYQFFPQVGQLAIRVLVLFLESLNLVFLNLLRLSHREQLFRMICLFLLVERDFLLVLDNDGTLRGVLGSLGKAGLVVDRRRRIDAHCTRCRKRRLRFRGLATGRQCGGVVEAIRGLVHELESRFQHIDLELLIDAFSLEFLASFHELLAIFLHGVDFELDVLDRHLLGGEILGIVAAVEHQRRIALDIDGIESPNDVPHFKQQLVVGLLLKLEFFELQFRLVQFDL